MWDLRTLAQFHRSEISPGLFQDLMNVFIRFLDPPLHYYSNCRPLPGGLPFSKFAIGDYKFPI